MNWQQRELLNNNNRGNNNRTSNYRNKNGNDQRGGGGWRDNRREASNNNSDLPAWADGLTNEPTTGTSGLNWQQQSLMQRDETDKFTHFVRGEDEFQRE